MSKPKKLDYKTQKEIWYKKLEESGFKDIEDDKGQLKRTSTSRNIPLVAWTAKLDYFQMATNFLEDYKFNSEIERLIWEYHSEGLSVREISDILTKANVQSISVTRNPIWEIIKRLKKSMYAMYVAPKSEYHE